MKPALAVFAWPKSRKATIRFGSCNISADCFWRIKICCEPPTTKGLSAAQRQTKPGSRQHSSHLPCEGTGPTIHGSAEEAEKRREFALKIRLVTSAATNFERFLTGC